MLATIFADIKDTVFYKNLKWATLLMLALVVPSAYLVSQLSVDNRQEKLVNQSGAAADEYRQFKQDFGQDEFVIMALSGRELFDEDTLDDALLLVEELEAVATIASVNGIPAIYRDLFGEEDPEALREEMTSTPFYENLLISADQSVAGLMVQLEPLDSVAERAELVAAIERIAAQAQGMGFRVDLVGQPIFSVAINRITAKETSTTFPIAGVAALLILLLLLRSVPAALAVLSCGGLSLLYTLAVIKLIGWDMNLITTSLPLVLFVLAIANGIHIASRFQRALHNTPDRVEAMRQTIMDLRRSCALSSITTALGFLSLLVADLNAISQMGIYMALGILFSLLTNFTVGAWLLIILPIKPAVDGGHKLANLLQRRVAFAMHYPRSVIGVFALVALAGAISVSHVNSSGDSMQFLPKHHPLTESHTFVSDRLTGLTAVEVVVQVPNGWLNDSYWSTLEQLTTDIAALEYVKRVYSPLSMLKKMHQWHQGGDPQQFRLPDSGEQAQEILTLLDDGNREQLNAYTTADGQRIRISILANLRGDAAIADLTHRIDTLTAALPEPLQAHSTGISVQMLALTEGLLATQLKSYILAFVLIFTTIGIGLRSRHLLLLSILPNVMPMLVIFILMWQLDIVLNTATVMVASISLGIAVDNTVHFLTRFHKQRQHGESAIIAAQSTIAQVGPSITITTVTACLGFFALVHSAFAPISHLGLLSGSAILAALISNLLFLPAIISLSPQERRNDYL
ncbi:MAG: MMPL family transporter [Halioglobus sp.]